MGTTIEDLAVVGTVVPDVACSTDDPSPWTALGTWAAIRSAVAHADGVDDLHGVTVAVQGAGHVGASLAGLLARDGAEVSSRTSTTPAPGTSPPRSAAARSTPATSSSPPATCSLPARSRA